MKKLQTKMLVVFSVLVMFMLIGAQILSYYQTEKTLTDNIDMNVESVVQEASQTLTSTLHKMEVGLNRYEDSKLVQSILADRKNEMIKKDLLDDFELYTKHEPQIASIYAGASTKEFYTSFKRGADHGADYDPTSRSWYKDALQQPNSIVWGDAYEDAATKELVVTGSKTLMSSNDELLGVMGLDLSLTEVQQAIGDIEVGYGGELFVLDRANRAIVYPGKNGEDVSGNLVVKQLMEGTKEPIEATIEGVDSIVYHSTLPHLEWGIGVIYPKESLFASLTVSRNASIGILGIALLVTVIAVYFIAKTITKPIISLSREVQKVSEGDLTVQLESHSLDEIGQLTCHFNEMVKQMNEMVGGISGNVADVDDVAKQLQLLTTETISSSREIASAMDSVAGHSTTQANEIDRITHRVETIKGSISDVHEAMDSMSQLSKEADFASKNGIRKLDGLRTDSAEAQGQLNQAEKAIGQLVEQSQAISDIIGTIQAISEQTNLLSLNASIEAARAGEHGRGFAVVAQEVRKLAEQSKEATHHVTAMIKRIQEETKRVSEAMVQMKKVSETQTDSVMSTEKAFLSITTISEKTATSIKEVAIKMEIITDEQKKFTEIIGTFASLSQETAAASEEINASIDEQLSHLEKIVQTSEQLMEDSEGLQESIKGFST